MTIVDKVMTLLTVAALFLSSSSNETIAKNSMVKLVEKTAYRGVRQILE